jgi:hypothetical protein
MKSQKKYHRSRFFALFDHLFRAARGVLIHLTRIK